MTSLSCLNPNLLLSNLLKVKSSFLQILSRKEIVYNRIYGYQRNPDGTIQVVEAEAKILRLIHKYYLSGLSISEIKNRLDQSNLRNRSNRLFTQSEIKILLTRKIYTGYIDTSFFNVKSKMYPAIISINMYRNGRKLLKNGKKQLICYPETACVGA